MSHTYFRGAKIDFTAFLSINGIVKRMNIGLIKYGWENKKAKIILEEKYKRKFIFNEIIDEYITFYPANEKCDYNYGVNMNDWSIKLEVLEKIF